MRIKEFFCIYLVYRPLLELDCIATRKGCDIYQLLGYFQITVVVNTYFRYDKYRHNLSFLLLFFNLIIPCGLATGLPSHVIPAKAGIQQND
jgi:hypothetical protein